MADNVAITAGSGTTIATDDVSAVHYQRVKLVDGTLDSTAAIPGDATNGLYVNVKSCVSHAVTNAGTFVVQATLGDVIGNQVIGGGTQTGTSDQSIMAASGSGSVYNYLCWVAVYNSSSTNTFVNVKDGSTVRLVLPLPAFGGAVFNLPYPIKGTGNTAWNLAAGAGVTTAYLYGGGYKGA